MAVHPEWKDAHWNWLRSMRRRCQKVQLEMADRIPSTPNRVIRLRNRLHLFTAIVLLFGVGITATRAVVGSAPRVLGADAHRSAVREPAYITTEGGFVIDHTSVELFDDIPPEYLEGARELGLLFMGNAPGQDINQALNCLSAPSWDDSDVSCRRDYIDTDVDWSWRPFTEADVLSGTVPARIWFEPDAVVYNRDNWTFVPDYGNWTDATQRFIQSVAPANIDSKDVLSYYLGYLTVGDDSTLLNPYTGFFVDNPHTYGIYDLEAYMAQHPDKTFVLWTSSLSREHGSQISTDFNNQMRQYAIANDLILFDLADIESFTIDDLGAYEQCYDSRDDVPYCRWAGQQETDDCENEPDDGLELPAICQDYTTQTYGGPLGSVSAGRLRVTKALWVLMARLAGWDGSVAGTPTAIPTATPEFTNTPTPPTPTPTNTLPPTPTNTPPPTPTPTNTPTPPPGSTPTNTPPPGSTPTNTPPPGSTPTPSGTVGPGTPTPTGTPNSTTEPTAGRVFLPSMAKN